MNPANGVKVQGWMAQDIDGTQFLDTSRALEDLIIPDRGKRRGQGNHTGEFRL